MTKSRSLDSISMPKINTDDLLDAHGVADLLGLSHPNSVSTYQRRYADMPRPVVDLGSGRCKLWDLVEVAAWAKATGRAVRMPEGRSG